MTIHQSAAETIRYIGYLREISAAISFLKEAEAKLKYARERFEAAQVVVANTPGASEALAAIRAAEASKGVQSHE